MLLVEEYFKEYDKYVSQYGERVCVWIQVGSFYETYQIRNEKGNADSIATLLNIQLTRKNKNIPTIDVKNPYMAGIPVPSLEGKYLEVLLDAHYTVVVIRQLEDKKTRVVDKIYSPSIRPLTTTKDTALCHILIEYTPKYVVFSVGVWELTTNRLMFYEGTPANNLDTVHDELSRIFCRHSIAEYVFHVLTKDGLPETCTSESILHRHDLYDTSLHVRLLTKEERMMTRIEYQNAYFRDIYPNVEFGMLEPIEYFDLEYSQIIPLNLIQMVEFVRKHDSTLLTKIPLPRRVQESACMTLHLDTIRQLNLLPVSSNPHKYNSVFYIVNKTKTAMGRRSLHTLLSNPLKHVSVIQQRYRWSEQIHEKEVETDLAGIVDLEKVHRRMELGGCLPLEWVGLDQSYEHVLTLYSQLVDLTDLPLSDTDVECLRGLMDMYRGVLDLEAVRVRSDDYIRTNLCPELDDAKRECSRIQTELEQWRQHYESLDPDKKTGWLRCEWSPQDGYYLVCSNTRVGVLKKEKTHPLKMDTTRKSGGCRCTNETIERLSVAYTHVLEKVKERTDVLYRRMVEDIVDTYSHTLKRVQEWVALVDILHANVECKRQYRYCLPIVKEGSSYFHVQGMRHPIMERLQSKTAYVPNDVSLDDTTSGMVLYALNSGGKSSLLRSIGICVVMAQCGLYVPCSSFEFSPFDHLITQVDMVDNLWKSRSSFVSEMMGLKTILSVANARTLVLSDELTKGTEAKSATAIFAATLLTLRERQCKFVCTTHLHQIADLPEIQKEQGIRIAHLAVTVQDDTIVFERVLKPGPCADTYGLEVARAVGLPKEFMTRAFQFREDSSCSLKQSRYNTRKWSGACEMCGHRPKDSREMPTDTHHILPQKEADKDDMIGICHKNSLFNLVQLCKSCHVKVHQNKVELSGYKATTRGVQLVKKYS